MKRCPNCQAIVNPKWDRCICCDTPIVHTGDFQRYVDQAVSEINRLWAEAGTTMNDIPLETRRHAFNLEAEMTDKSKAGDLAGARAALEEWQRCWIVK